MANADREFKGQTDNLIMENKTISYLETKMWYRFLEVAYIALFAYAGGITSSIMFYSGNVDIVEAVGGITLFLVIFWAIRGSFYYIVLGKFNPEKYKE